jgi:hypothetical protein
MREDDKLNLVRRGAWCQVESRNLTYDWKVIGGLTKPWSTAPYEEAMVGQLQDQKSRQEKKEND